MKIISMMLIALKEVRLMVISNEEKLIVAGKWRQEAIDQARDALKQDSVIRGALCADHFPGHVVPGGFSIQYKNSVSPTVCGHDIGCGFTIARLDVPIDHVAEIILSFENAIREEARFGYLDADTIYDVEAVTVDWASVPVLCELKSLAAMSFRMLGAGNHFIDLLI